MSTKGKRAKTKKPQLKVRDIRPKKDARGGLKIDVVQRGSSPYKE
jgi:hypothetical protein